MIEVACSTCGTPVSAEASFCPRCGPDSLALILNQRERTPTGASTETVRRLKAALGSQFEVVRLFGRGGFAEVYEVRDTELERRLAVKVLRADMAWTPGMLARFKQEARAVAQLTHPNTVPIHFVGEGEGLVFYVMPFIEGATLADVLRAQGPLDADRAISVALPVLEALDHAHRMGIVHRDIKPDNILIEAATGRPLLVDFGISKRVNEDGSMPDAHDGMVVGTPLYMSPEQALGHRDVDARTDIYAMGALLYQMITGAPPFDGTSSQEIVAKHLTDPVRVPPAIASRVPMAMLEVIERAMAKQPGDRFQSAGAMLEPLRQGARRNRAAALVDGRGVSSRINRDDPTLQMDAADAVLPVGRRRRRQAALLLALGTAMAGFGTGAALIGGPAPSLVVENALGEAVAVSVNGGRLATVAPGDSLRLPIERGTPLSAEWRVLRPRGAGGAELGDAPGGRFEHADPRGNVRQRLDAASIGTGYVIATVANATDDSLAVTLRDSSGARIDCDCAVPPGAAAAPLGYLSTVRVRAVTFTDAAGRTVTFDSLPARASASRAVVLRVTAQDFVSRLAASARPAEVPNRRPVEELLPDLKLPVPPAPAVDSAAARDSAASDSTPAEPRSTDPLAPIFPNRR